MTTESSNTESNPSTPDPSPTPSLTGMAPVPSPGPAGQPVADADADGADVETNGLDADIRMVEALKQVIDPELFVNIVDLGLIYSVNQEGSAVKVEMTLTSPACPAGPQLIHQARMALEGLDGVDSAEIVLTMSPPWSPERMTDDARDQLGIF